MTTEPLTVEELERAIERLTWEVNLYQSHEPDPDDEIQARFMADIRLVCEAARKAESHSRQLWLEAAEIAESHGTICMLAQKPTDCYKAIGKALRAKAESTPKPAPAKESNEAI